jgi:small multidrug resistance family-3 protein
LLKTSTVALRLAHARGSRLIRQDLVYAAPDGGAVGPDLGEAAADPALHRAGTTFLRATRRPKGDLAAKFDVLHRSVMFKTLQNLPIPLLLLAATVLEVSGDAVVRTAIYQQVGSVRLAWLLGGSMLLLGYGAFLNIAPVEFGRVVGLYIATLLVVWQIINFVAFRTLPGLPVWLGGALVIAGGVIITFWPATQD